MKKYFYLNGKVRPLDQAAIFANDLGLLRGYGIMDFLRTVNGKPFHLSDHYKRFCRSAKILDLPVPIKEAELVEIIKALLAKNKAKDASFRLILTPGRTDNGLDRNGQVTFFILTEDPYNLPPEMFLRGAKLITSQYERLLPEAKHLNYLWAIRLSSVRKKKGAVDILYFDNNKVTECSTSNIFLVKNGKLITPRDSVLKGVTRKTTIGLARKILPVTERGVKEKELWSADEIFITATNKQVLPIVKIDGKKIANGKVGPWTQKIMSAFAEYQKNY